MQKLFIILMCTVLILVGCTSNRFEPMGESPQITVKKSGEDINGVWISYLEFDKYLCGKSKSEFINTFTAIINNCKNIGINTVFVQVRSHADAYYNSEMFPTSKHLCGELGGHIDYDAMQIMFEICHENSISFHAWVNPYRAYSQDELQILPVENQIVKWYNEGTNLVMFNGRYYLNPASDEVIKFVSDGVKEILSYGVDGIHFDDYFYPTTDTAVDENEFKNSGYNDLQKFRLDAVSRLVSTVYKTVKEYNKDILFGVSPQGNIENNYNFQYADVKRWCSEYGYIDYIAPQIYYGFSNTTAPFSDTLNRWDSLITNSNVKLLVGLAAYKVGNESGEWSNEEKILYRQVCECRSKHNYKGIIFYRYDSLFNNNSEKIKADVEAIKTIIK